MWSKKRMPVVISYWLLPSILTSTLMEVSLVRRVIVAFLSAIFNLLYLDSGQRVSHIIKRGNDIDSVTRFADADAYIVF